MFIKKMTSLAVVALLAGVASSAWASPLLPGAAILAPSAPGTSGVTIVGSTGPVVITSPTFSGTVSSTVLKNDPSNPNGSSSNFLTFTYLIQNNAGSLDAMERLTIGSFAGFLTDVSYNSPATGVVPTSMDRSTAGDVVGFSFTPVLLGSGAVIPGSSSALLVIQTNAVGFASTNAYLIDGSVATVTSFAPAPGAGTPEPATLSIAALGGAALLFRRRRQSA